MALNQQEKELFRIGKRKKTTKKEARPLRVLGPMDRTVSARLCFACVPFALCRLRESV